MDTFNTLNGYGVEDSEARTSIEEMNTSLTEIIAKLGNVKSINAYTKTGKRNLTYPNLVQFTVPNASNCKLLITPSGGVTVPSHISRVTVTGTTVQILFGAELTADIDYSFDILAVETVS